MATEKRGNQMQNDVMCDVLLLNYIEGFKRCIWVTIGNLLYVIIKQLAYFVFLIQAHPDYDASVCHAFVHDICEEMDSFPFPPQSLDVILAVFVLSAIHPDR